MYTKLFLAFSFAAIPTLFSGCMVTNKTNGFQFNPPAKSTAGISPLQAAGKSKGLGSLWPKSFSQSATRPNPIDQSKNDATSLNSKVNVNAELFVVAGEMAIESQAYDTAENYFLRALAIESENVRAHLGLAKIHELKGENKKAAEIYTTLQKSNPNHPQLLNWLGKSRLDQPVKGPAITQESLIAAIAAIQQNENKALAATSSSAEAIEPSQIMVGNGLALNSAIEIKTRDFKNRLDNPYLRSNGTKMASNGVQNANYVAPTDVIDYQPGHQENLYGYVDAFSTDLSSDNTRVTLASAGSEADQPEIETAQPKIEEKVAPKQETVQLQPQGIVKDSRKSIVPESLTPAVIQMARPFGQDKQERHFMTLSDEASSRRIEK